MNIAYNIDCVIEMRQIPDKHFDLCVVDPPYGIRASEMHMGKGKHKLWKPGKKWDIEQPSSYKAGLDFIGFEIDKDYFEAQEKRFEEYTAQVSLFN